MPLHQIKNNASSLLASSITSTQTTLTVTAGQGALYPQLVAGQDFVGTLEDVNGNIEVVQATGVAGDTFTVARGFDNTTALAFASGSRFELRPTAAVLNSMLQKNGGDTLSGTTNNAGVIQQGTTGSIQGGEVAGAYHRGSPGETDNQLYVPPGGGAPTIGTSPILTTANLLNELPSGAGLMISGMVCLWSGASNAIPSGYVLCNGSGGTPDLRDKFVLGGGGTLPTSGGAAVTTTGSTDPTSQLSIAGTVLTVDELPAHSHNYWASSQIDFGGSSGSPIQTVGSSGGYVQNIPSGPGVPTNQQFIQNTGSGNPHTHAFTGNLNHSHSYNLPPYLALFYIMKT